MEKISYPEEIQSFFNEIIEDIKDKLDPECILIAGSFGKGSWLYAGEKLLSDFEFVFVCKKSWSLKKKKKLLNELNDKYPYEISLKGYILGKLQRKIISNYSFKNPGYIDLPFYDTFSDPQILYSKSEIDFPKLDVTEIPVWEAWCLFVNRLGDILYMLVNKDSLNDDGIKYYWLKCFESIADTYLIVNNLYEKNIGKRRELFTSNLLENDKQLDKECLMSFDIISIALKARAEHEGSVFNISDVDRKSLFDKIRSWLAYIEKETCFSENISYCKQDFNHNYINNSKLQNKYLLTNFKYNILLSNLIKVVFKPFLIFKLRLINISLSWRHIILLSIASTFKEFYQQDYSYQRSKSIVEKLFKGKYVNRLEGIEFLEFLLYYWKILR